MTTRMSADERREQVIRIAVEEFAVKGYAGTSTEAIARRVGVSQPYLFRLFPTKKDLFIAASRRCFDRVSETFEKAAADKFGEEALGAMGEAYGQLIAEDRELLLMQLQMWAACHDDDIRAASAECMGGLWQLVERLSGLSQLERSRFFAIGMLCNVVAAMNRGETIEPPWDSILETINDDIGNCI